ncbi:MAG: AsmA-like C-terminal region-containing protein [Candidatus Omnitrophota bacterium]
MKIKIVVIFAVIFTAVMVFLFYLNTVLFPVKFKSVIVKKIEAAINRRVDIGAVQFSLVRGFIIREFTIFDKDNSAVPFLTVEQASFNILYIPIIKEKKIVIPFASITQPVLNIIRKPGNAWNFDGMMPAPSGSATPDIFIGNISVDRGKINFIDESTPKKFYETLENIRVRGNLSFPKNAKFTFDAVIPNNPISSVSIKGTYDISVKSLVLQSNLGNIPLAKYDPFYNLSGLFTINDGLITAAAITANWKNGMWDITSDLASKDMAFKIKGDAEFRGSPIAKFTVKFDPANMNQLAYQGFLDPNAAQLLNVPFVKEIKDIGGRINFETNKITSEALSATIFDTKISMPFTLTDFSKPNLKLTGSCPLELKKLGAIFPDIFEREQMDVAGNSLLTFNFDGELSQFVNNLKATAILDNASVSAAKLPAPVTGISGKIDYQTNTASWENLTGIVQETKIISSGKLFDLANPQIDCSGSLDLNLEKLKLIFPDIFKENILDAKGSAAIKFSLQGPAMNIFSGQYHFDTSLNNISINSAKLPAPITAITGKLSGAPNLITWENLKGNFQDRSFILSGNLTDFSKPLIETAIASENIQIATKIQVLRNAFSISWLNGHYFDTKFDLKGDVFLTPDDNPRVDLKGNLDFNLENLGAAIPAIKETIDPLKLSGLCSIKGAFKGNLKNWRDWQVLIDIASPEVTFTDYRLSDIAITFVEVDRNINQFDISAVVYGGKLKLQSSADLTAEQIPYKVSVRLDNTDLSKLKADTIWKDKDISGYFSFLASVRGTLDSLNSIHGQGSIALTNGHIWQVNLLQGLGKFLFIPEFDNITFKEVAGDFVVEDGKVLTDNLMLASDPVTLTAQGWIDFAGNLNFDVLSEFSDEVIEQSSSLRKTITAFLTQTGDYLKIKLTGSLKEPKYNVSVSSGEVIRRTKDLLIEGLQGIFQ